MDIASAIVNDIGVKKQKVERSRSKKETKQMLTWGHHENKEKDPQKAGDINKKNQRNKSRRYFSRIQRGV